MIQIRKYNDVKSDANVNLIIIKTIHKEERKKTKSDKEE